MAVCGRSGSAGDIGGVNCLAGAITWLLAAIVVSTLTVRAPVRAPEPIRPPSSPDPSGEICPAIFGCEATT